MERLTKHQVNKLTASELKKRLPFQLESDGEVFAVVLPMKDVSKMPSPEIPKLIDNVRELPLSKRKQAEGRLSSLTSQ